MKNKERKFNILRLLWLGFYNFVVYILRGAKYLARRNPLFATNFVAFIFLFSALACNALFAQDIKNAPKITSNNSSIEFIENEESSAPLVFPLAEDNLQGPNQPDIKQKSAANTEESNSVKSPASGGVVTKKIITKHAQHKIVKTLMRAARNPVKHGIFKLRKESSIAKKHNLAKKAKSLFVKKYTLKKSVGLY